MLAYPEAIFAKYKTKGILIDTNLLLLITIGSYDAHRILTFKRTSQYSLGDLELMFRILAYFERRFTTPNILTEVDNLSRQLPEYEHEAIALTLSQLTFRLFEVFVPSADVVLHANYPDIGLTDCVTVASSDEVLVVTDDFRLSNILSSLGRDAININHIRNLDWL